MKIYYISPSTIPSRTANSIHVVNMCEALSHLGHDVVLFFHSKNGNSVACLEAITSFYGVSNNRIQAETYLSNLGKGVELGIALRSLFCFIRDTFKGDTPKFIISRNLYAAVFLGLIIRNSIIYETHTPEKGIRRIFQRYLLSSSKVQTIVISGALKKVLVDIYRNTHENIHVLHDAARAGQKRIKAKERKELQQKFLSPFLDVQRFDKIIGYFGHLYSGRGIDIIESLSQKHPNHAFIVYGGNEEEIQYFKNKNLSDNLVFMGHLCPEKIPEAMAMMSVLLMPYQQTVSIGLDGVDTAKWMSPMKMFEYMSVGVPIISSDLPVLREVLMDAKNCLLVKPDDIEDWSYALQRIVDSTELNERLGENAHNEYKREHTWQSRAKRMLKLLE